MSISSKSGRFVCLNFEFEQLLRANKYYLSTKDLKTQLANLQLCDDCALDGAVLLSSEFPDACLGQIHIIVEVSDGECPIISFFLSSSRSLLLPQLHAVDWIVTHTL